MSFTDNSTPLVRVQDLKVAFKLDKHHTAEAVKGVSFDIPANQTVALVGESGSGKSVTAMSIVRLLPENAIVAPTSQVLFQGHNLLAASQESMRALRGKDISVVFQDPMSSLNPVFTIGEQIAEVLRIHKGLSARQAIDRALELLNEVGIPNAKQRLKAYPHELSGGQQQRVMIAVAIACEPKLLIADEPTTALDVTVQRQVVDLMRRLQETHKMSMLFISHDLGLVGEVAQQVVVMRHGQVREIGSNREVFTAPKDSYTQALLACRPPAGQRPHRLTVIDDIINKRAPSGEQRPPRAITTAPLIEVTHLAKHYTLKEGLFKKRVVPAVKGADFNLYKGRTLGVVGESGSGKTTIGMMLTRLTEPTTGTVMLDGTDVTQLSAKALNPFRKRVQIIFQNPYASLNPRFTVGQILTEPMRIHGVGANDAERMALALGWLDKVGLPRESINKYPHEFSGGQRQRIAIARCLTMKPEIIVCDESVSALDLSVQATILNLLLDLQDEFGLTYVFISHDLSVVRYMSDDLLVMSQGEIVERGDAEEIFSSPKHAYTQQLLAAVPKGYTLQ